MSTLAKCPACGMGEHDRHIEHWDKAPEGVLGGAHCPCNGDCIAPDMSAWLGDLSVIGREVEGGAL